MGHLLLLFLVCTSVCGEFRAFSLVPPNLERPIGFPTLPILAARSAI